MEVDNGKKFKFFQKINAVEKVDALKKSYYFRKSRHLENE